MLLFAYNRVHLLLCFLQFGWFGISFRYIGQFLTGLKNACTNLLKTLTNGFYHANVV